MNKLKVKEMEYSHSFKYLPMKILINQKGDKDKYTEEKPGRHHLNQVKHTASL